MNETSFRIDYLNDDLTVLASETVATADDCAACEHGWDNMPAGATDFQVTMVDAD